MSEQTTPEGQPDANQQLQDGFPNAEASTTAATESPAAGADGAAQTLTPEGAGPAPASAPAAEPATAPLVPEAPKPPKRTVRRQVKQDVVNPVTAETTQRTVVTDEHNADLPAEVKLAAPYAYYDDDGALHSWGQGRIVNDPAEIALLVERGAVFEA